MKGGVHGLFSFFDFGSLFTVSGERIRHGGIIVKCILAFYSV